MNHTWQFQLTGISGVAAFRVFGICPLMYVYVCACMYVYTEADRIHEIRSLLTGILDSSSNAGMFYQ